MSIGVVIFLSEIKRGGYNIIIYILILVRSSSTGPTKEGLMMANHVTVRYTICN